MLFKLKKMRIKSDTLCILIPLYIYFIGFFITIFHVPESVLYASDIFLILAFSGAAFKVYRILFKSNLMKLTLVLCALIICGTFPLIIHGGSFLRWTWALRNWGRFFAYFAVGVSVLERKELNRFYDFTLKLFHINTVVIILQFLFMRNVLSQDQLNGLVGRNTSSTNLILILSATAIICAKYFTGKTRLRNVLMVICEGLLVSVLAELKAAIFFIFILFFLLMLVNMKPTRKQIIQLILLMGGGLILGAIAISMMVKVYPRFANILTVQGIIDEIANPHGYGFSGKIDRLTAIKVINEDFFHQKGSFFKMFGLGIGNAEYSTFDLLKSDFYIQYGDSYGYLNFSISMLYLETGYVGLILFTVAMLILLMTAVKWLRHCHDSDEAYMYSVGIAEVLVILLFIIYNNLQRTDMSLLLAIYAMAPWVVMKEKGKKVVVHNEKDTSAADRTAYK